MFYFKKASHLEIIVSVPDKRIVHMDSPGLPRSARFHRHAGYVGTGHTDLP